MCGNKVSKYIEICSLIVVICLYGANNFGHVKCKFSFPFDNDN